MSGTDTGTTMTNRFVGQRELSKVMSNHLRFDFNLIECLPVVDADDGTDHIRQHDHVSEMCLHHGRFLVHRSFFLRFPQFLHQCKRFHLQTTCESATCPGMYDLHELLARQIEGLIEINTSE